ncbi:hypothetical protein AGMMS49959_17810 [Planctomycetales bacterium]|nr:hypothetical protein AGMMS49959_17810 [Planctomycetales bacterium]
MLLGNTAHFINEGIDAKPVIMQSILPQSHYKGYDSVLNLQVTMLKQIIIWLKQRRIVCENGKCEIADAVYEIETFIPNLENTLTSDTRNAR